MSERDTSALADFFKSVAAGEIPTINAWQLNLSEGEQGWPPDIRELVSLGGDVIAAGNHWIIVTDELREDIVETAGDAVDTPTAVTVVMLNDLPQEITSSTEAMDELTAIGWMTATGDALVLPQERAG